jgi:hypothetical protein
MFLECLKRRGSFVKLARVLSEEMQQTEELRVVGDVLLTSVVRREELN